MDRNTIITYALAAAGALLLAWPWIAKQLQAFKLKLSAPVLPAIPVDIVSEHASNSVDQLASLVLMRQYLKHDSKAIEVIDTILAPAIMAASSGKPS